MILVGIILYFAVTSLFVVLLTLAAHRPMPTPGHEDDGCLAESQHDVGSIPATLRRSIMRTMKAPKFGNLLLVASTLLVPWTRADELTTLTTLLMTDAADQKGSLGITPLSLDSSNVGVWNTQVGEGFREGVWHAGFSLGGGVGARAFGSREAHDFVLGTTHAGRVMTGVLGSGHWYRGNVELVGELFGGRQLNPNDAYVAGFTPVLRYDLATGTRWMPFIEGGAGVSWTDVGQPDLATRFEFHLVGGGGVHWFCCENMAVTGQYRFAHLSNAGIRDPNNGVNTHVFLLGVTWFF